MILQCRFFRLIVEQGMPCLYIWVNTTDLSKKDW